MSGRLLNALRYTMARDLADPNSYWNQQFGRKLKMGKHDWILDPGAHREHCFRCGLSQTAVTLESLCPPWSTTGEGDTKANRAHEGEGSKDTREVNLEFLAAALTGAKRHAELYSKDGGLETIKEVYKSLGELIQKRDGLDRS